MNHSSGVFANQIRLEFFHSSRDCRRPSLDYRFPKPDNPGIGVNLQEQPTRLDEHGFQLCDPERVLGGDRRLASLAGLGFPVAATERGYAQTSKGSGDDLAAVDLTRNNIWRFHRP